MVLIKGIGFLSFVRPMATYKQMFCVGMVILCVSFLGHSQSVCPNSDFTQYNFNGWTGFTGNYNNPAISGGIVNGRHTIITTQGIDPFTCGGLQMIPPGGTVSARLGDSNTGAEAERLVYQTNVTAANSLFVYKYAAVLEDNGHTPAEQPEFNIRVLDQYGNQVSGACGMYTVYAGQPGQNFQTCNSGAVPVRWLPWTIVGVDLSPYIGQSIFIEFTTKDCSQSGHFGYAYISCECLPLLLDVGYCVGASSVTLTAPDGFQAYYWLQTGETTQSIVVNNPSMGSMYSCVVTTFSNQGNCSLQLNAQVLPTTLDVGYTASSECANTQIQFTDTSIVHNGNGTTTVPVAWQWDFGDGQTSTLQNPMHAFASPGLYTVRLIAYSSGGCIDTLEKQLDITPLPNVQYTFTNECIYETVQFTNQSTSALPLDYSWTFGDGQTADTANPSHVYTVDGTFIVKLIAEDTKGCTTYLEQPITIYPLPVISAGADVQICPGIPMTLNGSGGTTYTWNNGVVNNVAFIPPATAVYTVVGTDINGCKNTDSTLITVYPPAIVNAGPDQEVCSGTSVTFSGSGTVSYSWTGGVVDAQPFTPAVGTYTFTVTGTDGNGCQDTDDANLIVNANPIVSAGLDQVICVGAQTFVSGSGATVYAWNNGITNGVAFTPTLTANYTVVGTDQNGCQGTDQVTVAIEPPANVVFSAPVTSGCDPLLVNFTNLSTGTPGASCFWDFGDTHNEVGCGTVSHNYTSPGCHDVELIVTTAIGCTWSKVIPNYICVFPNPVATFVPMPGVISELHPTSEMNNSSTGAVNYAWDFGDGSSSVEDEPEHTFPATPIRNHIVELIAYSNQGCTDTAEATIIMNPDLIFYVPNTFTPDFDNFNQTFQPIFTSGFDPYAFKMLIFDRWGEILFETNDASIGWNGTYHDKIAKEGVYTWKILFKMSVNDEHREEEGHITLLR